MGDDQSLDGRGRVMRKILVGMMAIYTLVGILCGIVYGFYSLYWYLPSPWDLIVPIGVFVTLVLTPWFHDVGGSILE